MEGAHTLLVSMHNYRPYLFSFSFPSFTKKYKHQIASVRSRSLKSTQEISMQMFNFRMILINLSSRKTYSSALIGLPNGRVRRVDLENGNVM